MINIRDIYLIGLNYDENLLSYLVWHIYLNILILIISLILSYLFYFIIIT